jgi:hypothetical protein
VKILIPNKTTDSRLNRVYELMIDLGAPIIECIQIGDGLYLALEGSHRLNAAKKLGIMPILDSVTDCDAEDPDMEWVLLEATRRKKKGLELTFDPCA